MMRFCDCFTLCQVVTWIESASDMARIVRAVLVVKRLHASNGARTDTDRNSDPAHTSANIDDCLVSSDTHLYSISNP
jgi:hypothetical protein